MASEHGPPDSPALRQLIQLVQHLGAELTTFRRRALQAEARVRSLEGSGSAVDAGSRERLEALEAENEQLRSRLDFATTRTQQLLNRVRFLRQQNGAAPRPTVGAGRSR